MIQAVPPLAEIAAASRRIAHEALNVGENRLELLVVEVQEACERLLHAFLYALGMAVCALLAGITLTAGFVVVFWNAYPLVTLAVFTILYGGLAFVFYSRLGRLRREWQVFTATLDQLQKDRECLEKALQ